jgi:uncharacterized protein
MVQPAPLANQTIDGPCASVMIRVGRTAGGPRGQDDGPGECRSAGYALPMDALDQIGHSRYISFTTYRKDGTAVATPVWHTMNDGRVLIVSDEDAWKVKRIRNNSRVVVTVCDFRGKIAPGAPSAEGSARLLDQAETQAARALIARKYVMSRLGNWFAKTLHVRKTPVIGIAVTF